MKNKPEWLFIGTYPNAYVYADMRKETGGDYHTIAHVYFRPLELKVFDHSEKYEEAVAIATVEYNKIRKNITTPIRVSATGQTVLPYLPGMDEAKKRKLYDTQEKRLKFIRKKGNIITFKEPFYPRGTMNESRLQIIVIRIQKEKSGAVKIEGRSYDSNWYKKIDELIDAIDWEWMEEKH